MDALEKLRKQRYSRSEKGRAAMRRARAKYRSKPETIKRHKEQAFASRLAKHGLTVDDYCRQLRKQHGKCAICEAKPKIRRLAVDHDHESGRVRGLLCFRCNYFLGIRDSERLLALLARATYYIERFLRTPSYIVKTRPAESLEIPKNPSVPLTP